MATENSLRLEPSRNEIVNELSSTEKEQYGVPSGLLLIMVVILHQDDPLGITRV
jgi:hypothetical protein